MPLSPEEVKLRVNCRNYINNGVSERAKIKFTNFNGKTSQYDVHDNLFQDRTSRMNRVLLPFKLVLSNNLSLAQLESFENGVCVEFVNDDYYNIDFEMLPIHGQLKNLIGTNGVVSAIISFRSEDGEPGAEQALNAYNHYKNNLEGIANNPTLIPLSRAVVAGQFPGQGNEHWNGNAFWSIRGGVPVPLESHDDKVQLFNPAIDYANERVCFDIELVMHFFVLHCHDAPEKVGAIKKKELIEMVGTYLDSRKYSDYPGTLLEYCNSHPTMILGQNLTDPIRIIPISINWLDGSICSNLDELNLSHNEAAQENRIYFDNLHNYVLSAARPTNLFLSTKLSNMTQQHFTLDGFWKFTKENLDKYNKAQKKNKLSALFIPLLFVIPAAIFILSKMI